MTLLAVVNLVLGLLALALAAAGWWLCRKPVNR
jgi:hypothetical protein